MQSLAETLTRQIGEVRAQRDALAAEARGVLERNRDSGALDPADESLFSGIEAELGKLREQEAGLQRMLGQARTVHLGGIPGIDPGSGYGQPAATAPPAGHGGWNGRNDGDHIQHVRTAAMAALTRAQSQHVMDAAAADRAERVLRHGDRHGLTAEYLAAVGSEAYESAFSKMARDPQMGHLRYSAEEVEAVRAVDAAMTRAPIFTSTTGVPLPLTIDPTIILTGTGALNPVRDVASQVTIGTHSWEGVSSDGVTASYVAEGVEATDATPALVGPSIATQQGRAFVRASLEAFADWESLQGQLADLIVDARSVLDATMFLTGTGTNQPCGILNIGGTGGLTTTQRVQTATTATYAVGDPWLLKAGIPARFINNTTFASAPATWDTTYQFVAQGSTTAARQFSDGDRGGDFLGRPKIEWSTMATGSTTGTRLIIAGDFKTAYKIVDRLGMSVELVPHLFGTVAQLPVGQRGLYCYWRTGAAVVAPNALRYLEVK